MKKPSVITACLFLISFSLAAQPRIKNYSSNRRYTQRIERIVSLINQNNDALKILYNSSGKAFSVTEIVNEAILKNEIAIYENNDDSMILMDKSKTMQVLSYTYDSTSTKQTLLIDNIIITEDWSIDHNTGRMLRDSKWFLLCSNKDAKSGNSIPLYKLRTDGFLAMCKPYYILMDNNKMPLTTYFEDRLYKSNIISVKKVNTITSGDSVPEIPDAVVEEMLNR